MSIRKTSTPMQYPTHFLNLLSFRKIFASFQTHQRINKRNNPNQNLLTSFTFPRIGKSAIPSKPLRNVPTLVKSILLPLHPSSPSRLLPLLSALSLDFLQTLAPQFQAKKTCPNLAGEPKLDGKRITSPIRAIGPSVVMSACLPSDGTGIAPSCGIFGGSG